MPVHSPACCQRYSEGYLLGPKYYLGEAHLHTAAGLAREVDIVIYADERPGVSRKAGFGLLKSLVSGDRALKSPNFRKPRRLCCEPQLLRDMAGESRGRV